MTLSARIFTPDGEIGVADNAAGDEVIIRLRKQYGNCKAWIYDRNDIFGRGYDKARPMLKTTLAKFDW